MIFLLFDISRALDDELDDDLDNWEEKAKIEIATGNIRT